MNNHFFTIGLSLFLLASCGKSPEKKIEMVSDTVVVKEYFSNKKVKSEASSLGGLRQGWTRNYDREGRLLSEVYYVNNIREGTARNYYAATGKLNSTLEFKKGVKEGNEIWFYESGQKYRVSPYINGLMDGTQKYFFEQGSPMAEIPYKAGSPGIGLKEYKKDGTLISDYPRLLIRKEDHLKDANKILLIISLSSGAEGVKFYKGPLIEGKYLGKKMLTLATQKGITQIDYNIPPGAAVNQKVIITANYKTPYGNPLILSKVYVLQVINSR